MTDTKKPTKSTAFSDDEKSAMKERAKEQKAAAAAFCSLARSFIAAFSSSEKAVLLVGFFVSVIAGASAPVWLGMSPC
jgi:hypothetical protein